MGEMACKGPDCPGIHASNSFGDNVMIDQKSKFILLLFCWLRDSSSFFQTIPPTLHIYAFTFYASYFSKIVINANIYFQLSGPECTLFAKTLADKILCHFSKTNSGEPVESFKPISEREMGGLQYLAGYVLRKLKSAAQKNKNRTDGDAELSILQKAVSVSDDNQALIHAINRGGLTIVRDEWVQVFIVAEEAFRTETLLPARKIDT